MSVGILEEEPRKEGIPRSVEAVAAFFVALVFLTFGLSGNPSLVSTVMWLLLAGYLVVTSLGETTPFSWYIALAMASLHAGAILSYYSDPMILPFLIIERIGQYASANIDFVQVIIVVEVARRLLGEKLKKPTREIHEAGAGGEAAVV